jgi:hypothetical protein
VRVYTPELKVRFRRDRQCGAAGMFAITAAAGHPGDPAARGMGAPRLDLLPAIFPDPVNKEEDAGASRRLSWRASTPLSGRRLNNGFGHKRWVADAGPAVDESAAPPVHDVNERNAHMIRVNEHYASCNPLSLSEIASG